METLVANNYCFIVVMLLQHEIFGIFCKPRVHVPHTTNQARRFVIAVVCDDIVPDVAVIGWPSADSDMSANMCMHSRCSL